MKSVLSALLVTTMSLVIGASRVQGQEQSQTPMPTHLQIDLEWGEVLIELRPDLAPNHVQRVVELADSGFYDGIVFHRVIEGFMAQTGDPDGKGTGGSGQNIKAEFSEEPFVRGTVGMARSGHPDSADSQFFICFDDAQFLNGQYTVFGQVVEGMAHVDRIKRGDQAKNGAVTDPDHMVQVRSVSLTKEE